MPNSSDIVVIGSINKDLIINTPKIPVIGETVIGGGFTVASGGKGANQAVACAKLGGGVALIGAVGNDAFGYEMVTEFQKLGIDTDYIKHHEGLPTGTAVIVLHEGDNFIIIDRGANASVSQNDIIKAEDIIKNAKVLITQLEIPLEINVFAMKLAKKYNIPILFNPAPAVKLDDDVLALADIITPNETESEILTGLPVKTADDAKSAALYLMNKGIKQVVITMGENGCVYNDGEVIKHAKAVKAEKVVDTTAAGDSFTGALAVSVTEGKNINDAIGFSLKVGAVTVSRIGAQPSLPFRHEIT